MLYVFRILRLDRKERMNRQKANFLQLPIFRQLAEKPQDFKMEFRQLPPKLQGNLMRVLHENAPDDFAMNELIDEEVIN